MAVIVREVEESPKGQGYREQPAYTFIWTAIGTPTSPAVKLFDPTYRDVSAGQLSGSSSIVGSTVITPLVLFTEADIDQEFRLECEVSIGGNTLIHFLRIIVER